MNLRVLLPLLATTLVVSCGPSSMSTISDCAGICSGGTTCDPTTGRCVAPTTNTQAATGLPCDVANVFATKCASCHGATPAGGAPNSLVTREQFTATSALGGTVASRCVTRINSTQSPMPPSYTGDSVTPAEAALVQNWVNQGLPGGACAQVGATATNNTGGGNGATGGGTGSNTGGGFGSMPLGGGTTNTGGGSGTTGGGTGTGTGGGAGTTSVYCQSCASSTACGGSGNLCLNYGDGNFCGTNCAINSCAAGQECVDITNTAGTVVGSNCVPLNNVSCSAFTTGGTGGGTGTGTGGGTGSGGGTGTGGGGGTMQCTPDTWANYGQSFFATNCASCHHHTGEFGTKSFVTTYKSSITSRISSGNMPPSGLTSAQKTRILKYLSCGVP